MLCKADGVIWLDTPATRTYAEIAWQLAYNSYKMFAVFDDLDHLLRHLPTPWFDKNPEYRDWVLKLLDFFKTAPAVEQNS